MKGKSSKNKINRTIWIVQGSTGEYSDRYDWAVCAYHSKKKADEHASKAMHRAMEIKNGRNSMFDEIAEGLNEFDLSMQMDYTGTSYTTYSVKIVN